MWVADNRIKPLKYERTNTNMERYEVLQLILEQNDVLVLNKAAEVGVRHAETSEYLLTYNPKLHLTCIDPYLPYQDVVNFYDLKQQISWKENAAKKLARFGDRVTWIYETSAKSSLDIPDSSLDFVFIDAEHTFAAAFTDCTLWSPKVRPGGLLCGHDYGMHPVRDGVNKFAGKRRVHHAPYLADVWIIQL